MYHTAVAGRRLGLMVGTQNAGLGQQENEVHIHRLGLERSWFQLNVNKNVVLQVTDFFCMK